MNAVKSEMAAPAVQPSQPPTDIPTRSSSRFIWQFRQQAWGRSGSGAHWGFAPLRAQGRRTQVCRSAELREHSEDRLKA